MQCSPAGTEIDVEINAGDLGDPDLSLPKTDPDASLGDTVLGMTVHA